MRLKLNNPNPKQKLWKTQTNALLNRSQHWAAASSYKDAREKAIAANIEVQHQIVR